MIELAFQILAVIIGGAIGGGVTILILWLIGYYD